MPFVLYSYCRIIVSPYPQFIIFTLYISTFLLYFELQLIMCMHQSQRAMRSADKYDKTDLILSDSAFDCSYIDVVKSINSNQKDLRILQHNIRGISSKVTYLKHLLDNTFNQETPDIVLLCETWLNDNSPILQIPGYNIELTNRTTKTGGGVAILIADNIQYRHLPNPQPNEKFEACFIDLKTKNKTSL